MFFLSWGVFGSGKQQSHVIHVGYESSNMRYQQMSKREQTNTLPAALSLRYALSPGPPAARLRGAPAQRAWRLLLGEKSFRCALVSCIGPRHARSGSPLERTSLESLLRGAYVSSKINFQGTSIFCFWVKQNEVGKTPWGSHGFSFTFSLWNSSGRFATRKTALEQAEAQKCLSDRQCGTETYFVFKNSLNCCQKRLSNVFLLHQRNIAVQTK